MLPSRREWRPNLRRECRAHDSSGCRPGCYGPGVSGGALHAARPVPGSQVRLGGNVRVVDAAGIHNHKQAVMLYSSRGRFRPASHCFLSPQIRDTVNLETAASGPSASVNAASTSRVDKPRTNPTMTRPPARWSWCACRTKTWPTLRGTYVAVIYTQPRRPWSVLGRSPQFDQMV